MTDDTRRPAFDAVGTPRLSGDEVDLGPRVCVECGETFLPPQKGPGQHKRFCKTSCRTDFANREKVRGSALVTVAQVYALTRHGRTEEDRDLRRRCWNEMTAILKVFNDEDKACGRDARIKRYARQLVHIDSNYNERSRGPRRKKAKAA
jgi:hypothetical protein